VKTLKLCYIDKSRAHCELLKIRSSGMNLW